MVTEQDTKILYVEDDPSSEILVRRVLESEGFQIVTTSDGLSAIEIARRELPDLILGVGSVVDAGTCALYIQSGARFIVSPLLNEEMARVCNRRKILWIPGCATASEINKAEELGAEIVKIFPGPTIGGPKFLKAFLGPCPWSNILPSGGVEPTEENLSGWFEAGAFAVGMGSALISKDIIKNKDFARLEKTAAHAVQIIKDLRKD